MVFRHARKLRVPSRVARTCAGALLCLAAHVASASDVPLGTIKTIATNTAYPGVVFVEVLGQRNGSPTCHTNPAWTYALHIVNDDGRRMFALLTSAKLTQSSVRLAGSNVCDVFAGIETLSQVWLV